MVARISQSTCLLVLSFGFICSVYYFYICRYQSQPLNVVSISSSDENTLEPNVKEHHEDNETSGFLINQPGCRIPEMFLSGPLVDSFVEKEPTLDCSLRSTKECKNCYQPSLVFDDDHKIFINHKMVKYYNRTEAQCFYQAFRRLQCNMDVNDIDDKFENVGKPHLLTNETKINGETNEFISVRCTERNQTKSRKSNFYRDFFSFVPRKRLTEKRCKSKKTAADSLSVLIIGLDALSRLNFQRQMKSSYQYLMENMGAIEMRGYNKVGDNTFPNLIPVLTGLSVQELTQCWPTDKSFFDNCTFIWNDLAERGYRTVFAEDSTNIGVFNYLKNGFCKQPTDYYFRPFNYAAEKFIGHNIPGNCYLCVGSRLNLAVLLKYATKHVRMFKDERFFGLFWSSSLTHDYMNFPQQGDLYLLEFLQRLNDETLLNNTVLIIMSDHGLRWGSFRETYQGHLEERLPLLTFVLPEWFRDKYPKAMQGLLLNADRLTTPYDLHQTLYNFANLSSLISPSTTVNRSSSLFAPVSTNRTCSTVGIPKHYCTCHDMILQLPTDDKGAMKASIALVQHINYHLLKDHPQCAQLHVDKLENVIIEQSSIGGMFAMNGSTAEHPTKEAVIVDYMVTVKMKPGNGVFEATVRHKKITDTYTIVGSISRVNTYGKQGYCINNYILRLYCYCGGNSD